jgi:DNA-binding IclR family transcriptional regulator
MLPPTTFERRVLELLAKEASRARGVVLELTPQQVAERVMRRLSDTRAALLQLQRHGYIEWLKEGFKVNAAGYSEAGVLPRTQ